VLSSINDIIKLPCFDFAIDSTRSIVIYHVFVSKDFLYCRAVALVSGDMYMRFKISGSVYLVEPNEEVKNTENGLVLSEGDKFIVFKVLKVN
jgi:hypothetical protein